MYAFYSFMNIKPMISKLHLKRFKMPNSFEYEKCVFASDQPIKIF